MVACLEKSTGSVGFHQIIDFITRSHVCYALTKKPEVCVSFIRQFWRSAEILTDDNGTVKIHATIDGHSLSITEVADAKATNCEAMDVIMSARENGVRKFLEQWLAKLPMLKLGEYEMWEIRIKQYFLKRGLSILEAQVVIYKESEVLFSEEIALLKRSVGHKEYLMGLVKTELEKAKEEKEGFEFKLAKFEKSSKDLDDLLASQVTDKSKRGFGYNDVPSPHPLILNRPTPLDLSYSGLEEFQQPGVNEYGSRDSSLKPTTVCDRESENSKENTDDSLKQQHKTVTETSSVKENNGAPIIEDWVSDDEGEVEPIPKVEKKTAIPTATKKESVKPGKPIRRSV
ncbi:hypothetical protein Tco_0089623, partial [Tanacetum coccineum]